MARRQIEIGARNVQEDDYKGRVIRVVTGYESGSDKWPIHVFVETNGRADKISGQFRADSQAEAFEAGFSIGQAEIDAGNV